MTIEERVRRAIAAAVEEVNLGLPADRRLRTDPGVELVGPGARLDSLGLVNFVVAAEQRLREEFRVALSLTDVVMSQDPERYGTLGALSETVVRLLKERKSGS